MPIPAPEFLINNFLGQDGEFEKLRIECLRLKRISKIESVVGGD